MADAIFGLVGQILVQMGSDAVKEIGSAIGVTKELKRLETTLSTIKAVFKDADEQQLNSHELTDWFKLIKYAMYEAEDIIDDFATEALHQKMNIQESSYKKCLPEWMPTLTSLQKLSINDCEQLTSRCKKETGEDWHKIAHIPNILLDNEIIQDK